MNDVLAQNLILEGLVFFLTSVLQMRGFFYPMLIPSLSLYRISVFLEGLVYHPLLNEAFIHLPPSPCTTAKGSCNDLTTALLKVKWGSVLALTIKQQTKTDSVSALVTFFPHLVPLLSLFF